MANPTGWKPTHGEGREGARRRRARPTASAPAAPRAASCTRSRSSSSAARPGGSGVSLPQPTGGADPARRSRRRSCAPAWTGMPEISELEVIRHFTRLSAWNHGIDTGFYPLGSCTMKYNPKSSEALARLPGFANVHPLAPRRAVPGGARAHVAARAGALRDRRLRRDRALARRPGAHGELCGLMVIRAYHAAKGNPRKQGAHPRHRPRHEPGLGGAERLRRRAARLRARTAGSTPRR